MARSRSGYKRHRNYQPPAGVRIPVRTEEAWNMLTTCARENGCTVGQWAEASLRYALSGQPYIGAPEKPATSTPLGSIQHFEISQALWSDVEAKTSHVKALAWIASTLLYLAAIELERHRGVREQSDRFV